MEELYQSRYSGPEIDRRLGLMAGNFLWIKWSATFPVVEMLDEPGPYIGIYTGEADTPPEDPAEYKWYLNKGDTGTGLDILGTYVTVEALEAAIISPAQGDMYNVGEAAPYHVYMWDTTEPPGAWEDQGILHGQDGAPGPNEITTATATPLSGVLVGKDGYVKEGVAGVDFVPPISGASADLPVFTSEGGMLGTKSIVEALAALGFAPENYELTPAADVTLSNARCIKYGRIVFLTLNMVVAEAKTWWTPVFSGVPAPLAASFLFALADGALYALHAGGETVTTQAPILAGTYVVVATYLSAA